MDSHLKKVLNQMFAMKFPSDIHEIPSIVLSSIHTYLSLISKSTILRVWEPTHVIIMRDRVFSLMEFFSSLNLEAWGNYRDTWA